MGYQMTGEELFNKAKKLFNFSCPVTAILQNPGTVTTQDQVEGLLRLISVEVHNKEKDVGIKYCLNRIWKGG